MKDKHPDIETDPSTPGNADVVPAMVQSKSVNRGRGAIYGTGSLADLAAGNPEKLIKNMSRAHKSLSKTAANAPTIPSELIDQRIINDDHARHFIQHGAENRNPYETLVAKLEGLPIICISALGSTTDAFGTAINYQNKDFSPLMKNSAISQNDKTTYACLPHEYIVAAAITAAKLGGPNSVVTSRVTLWAQDSIPCAPKPPATKLKSGKGGISGGVIPVDLETTTNEGPGGKLVALPQDAKQRPNLEKEKDMTTVQWAKPLDQIVLGLDKNPADFTLLTSAEDIQKNGYIEFKVNCAEGNIDQAVYRMNLKQDPNSTVKPVNAAQTIAVPPVWWHKDFGDFNIKAREGYNVEYKKNAEQTEYKSYEVYARLGRDGSKLPLSGDQDLFFIPRSEKYNLGKLATQVMDTHAKHGVHDLVDAMKEVHKTILKQDVATGEVKREDMQKSEL
jgi:hypothetical protein